ncbi:MAG: hypothetical protein Q7S61_04080 [bacterium]|nr:hypothetical protein [bacterium]
MSKEYTPTPDLLENQRLFQMNIRNPYGITSRFTGKIVVDTHGPLKDPRQEPSYQFLPWVGEQYITTRPQHYTDSIKVLPKAIERVMKEAPHLFDDTGGIFHLGDLSGDRADTTDQERSLRWMLDIFASPAFQGYRPFILPGDHDEDKKHRFENVGWFYKNLGKGYFYQEVGEDVLLVGLNTNSLDVGWRNGIRVKVSQEITHLEKLMEKHNSLDYITSQIKDAIYKRHNYYQNLLQNIHEQERLIEECKKMVKKKIVIMGHKPKEVLRVAKEFKAEEIYTFAGHIHTSLKWLYDRGFKQKGINLHTTLDAPTVGAFGVERLGNMQFAVLHISEAGNIEIEIFSIEEELTQLRVTPFY